MKDIIDRITINNILAFIIILGYVSMWSFTLFMGLEEVVPEGHRVDLVVEQADLHVRAPADRVADLGHRARVRRRWLAS